jgi:hypothetical protein
MRAFITILFILFYLFAFSQQGEQKDTKITSINLGIGVAYGQQIGLSGFSTLGLSNKIYTGIHIIGTSYEALNMPEDYSSPMGSPSDPPPTDRFTCISALIGRKFQNEKNGLSFSLESGISWVRYNKASFDWIRSPGLFGGYLTEYNPVHVPGLLLGSRFNSPVTKRMSLDFSFHGSVNSARSVGFGSLSFVVSIL